MVREINIREIERDDELAILKKNISLPNIFSFETPTRSIKEIIQDRFLHSNLLVNEITRKVDDDFLKTLEEGATSRVTREIKSRFLENRLNLVIFNLIFDQIPEQNLVRTLAQQLYSSSHAIIFLPTIRTALLKENGKFSEKKVQAYLEMVKNIVNEIEVVGNVKPFVGTIPLIPIKYSRPIIDFYHSNGITSFAIDANTKDVLSNETDLRSILSEINNRVPLSKAFIYACNLGYPRYEGLVTRADDFLSIFAYIDVIGGTFKIRGLFPQFGRPRKKIFSREHYSYEITVSPTYTKILLDNFNQSEQLKEAHKVRELIGEEKVKQYIQTKTAVDEPAMKRLESIATKVRPD